jgi:hypothetical protein
MEQTQMTERLALLRKAFEPHQISKLPKPTKAQTEEVRNNFKAGVRCDICGTWHHPKVVHLDYVGHAALTDRLLDVDPTWSWEPLATDEKGLPALDKDGGLWIKLTICGVTRLGYGDAQGKTGGDAMKERIGDALRNAAMRFGAALDLWHKGTLHLETEAEPEPAAVPDSVGLANAVNAIKSAGTVDDIAKHLKAGVALYPNSKDALTKHASERKAQLTQQLAEQA